jgi:putative transposase
MECDDTPVKDESEEETQKLCQKIRIHPTAAQAVILRKWMKGARDTYNMGLRLIKDGKAKPNLALKKLVVTASDTDSEAVKAIKETPANIRVRAIHDLIHTFKTARAGFVARKHKVKTQKKRWNKRKKKEKLGRRRWKKRPMFTVKYKSKRLTRDSMGFESKSVKVQDKQLFLFSTQKKFGMQSGIRMSEEVKHPVDVCCRISYVFGRWYFLLPYDADTQSEVTQTQRVCALDMGERTAITYYAEDEIGEIGGDIRPVADKINNKIDALKSKIASRRGQPDSRRKINRLRRAWYRANARSSNLIADLHWKVIKHMLHNFDVIIFPRLHTASMLRKDSNLNAITKKRLAFFRHGEFSTRFALKASIARKELPDLEEHGTSMTCSCCGAINKDLGSSSVFVCPNCSMIAGRDVNAGKNHVLKHLVGKKNY